MIPPGDGRKQEDAKRPQGIPGVGVGTGFVSFPAQYQVRLGIPCLKKTALRKRNRGIVNVYRVILDREHGRKEGDGKSDQQKADCFIKKEQHGKV